MACLLVLLDMPMIYYFGHCAMQQMIQVCESFADKNNLKFSTDKDPSKSKGKCIYIIGK